MAKSIRQESRVSKVREESPSDEAGAGFYENAENWSNAIVDDSDVDYRREVCEVCNGNGCTYCNHQGILEVK